MKGLRLFAALVAAAVVVACGEKNAAQSIAAPTAGSAVKFFNFGVGAPQVNFYVDTQQITAVSFASCSSAADGKTTDSTCLTTGKQPTTGTTGTGYGQSASTTGLYFSVKPGSYTLSGRITGATNTGVAISNTPATFDNGKFYSYYLSGIYSSSTTSVEGFVIEDPLPDVDMTSTYVRFVNASSNSQPMTLHLKNSSGADSTIGSAIAYKGGTAFVKIAPGNYDISTYVAGSAAAVIAKTGVAFNIGHAYTVTAYGDITNKPAFDVTANR